MAYKANQWYRVSVGPSIGYMRRRWHTFSQLADAKEFCDRVFQRTGIVLAIEVCSRYRKET